MDNNENSKNVLKQRRRAFVILMMVALTIGTLLLWAVYLRFARSVGWAAWTGFEEFISPALAPGQEYYPGKTLWDWLELLIVPVVLAGGALLFNRSERRAEREIAKKRDQTEREIANDRVSENALQTYLDRMTELLLEKNLRNSEPEEEVVVVARARTLTVLRSLDADRKGALVRFLYEAHLIDRDKVIINLSGANLSNANLYEANLKGVHLGRAHLDGAIMVRANLEEANLDQTHLEGANLFEIKLNDAYLQWAKLEGARLEYANLIRADFQYAGLEQVNLRGARLMEANLRRATLPNANLNGAKLVETDLTKADLRGADLQGDQSHGIVWSEPADLTGASLRGATLTEAKISHEQLAQAILDEDTTMPDGTKYSPPTTEPLPDSA
jgi:uncharacterized protein YjbI with pentapeptide repeats